MPTAHVNGVDLASALRAALSDFVSVQIAEGP